jgi:hypothetical protein
MTTSRSLQVLASLLAALLSVTSVPAQQGNQITVRGIGALHMCERLRRANVVFPNAGDTVITGEGFTIWPSKLVALGGNEWIMVESSWIDTAHVWRVTTNSPRYQAPHGARVGMSIQDMLDRHQELGFSYPEGEVVVTLVRDSVSFLVDDHSATEFWAHVDYKSDSVDALAILDHAARIRELFVSGSCKH